jgi:nucleotide-binding universal stress UspA family protein
MHDAHALVDRAVAELPPGAEADVLAGRPRDELVRVSHDVDLMVVGSRGWGPVRRTLLGGTSRYLVEHAACPVIAVPRGTEIGSASAATAVVA